MLKNITPLEVVAGLITIVIVMFFSTILYCAYFQFSINERQTNISDNMIRLANYSKGISEKLDGLENDVKHIESIAEDFAALKEEFTLSRAEFIKKDEEFTAHLEELQQDLTLVKSVLDKVAETECLDKQL